MNDIRASFFLFAYIGKLNKFDEASFIMVNFCNKNADDHLLTSILKVTKVPIRY